MEASYLSDSSYSSKSNAVLQSKSIHTSKCFPLAVGITILVIGIIVLMSSLVATACLYAHIGNLSLGIGGGGLIVALALMALGVCYSCTISSQPHVEEKFYSNGSQSASVDSEEIAEKKSVNHPSMEQLQVPIRAADIKLSESLPKEILSQYRIHDTQNLSNHHLHRYMTHLAIKFPSILVPGNTQMAYKSSKESIDGLHDYIFNYLPSQYNSLNSLDLPIYLHIPTKHNHGSHWTLVYIDRERRTVEYYDSLKNYGNHSEIVQKLTIIAEELSRQEPNQPPYKFVSKMNKVLQFDDYQCGPWILYFLEKKLIHPEFDFNQLDVDEAQEYIKTYRRKVALKVIEMTYADTVIRQQEEKYYLQKYKEAGLAYRMRMQELIKIPYIDRWKQVLNGQSLIPGPIL